MKIVYTPIATLVPSLTPEQEAEILAAAGLAVARRALGCGMKVLAVDIDSVSPEPGVTLSRADRLHDLLGAADVVVIALPLTKATLHLVSRDVSRRLQRHAILVSVT